MELLAKLIHLFFGKKIQLFRMKDRMSLMIQYMEPSHGQVKGDVRSGLMIT